MQTSSLRVSESYSFIHYCQTTRVRDTFQKKSDHHDGAMGIVQPNSALSPQPYSTQTWLLKSSNGLKIRITSVMCNHITDFTLTNPPSTRNALKDPLETSLLPRPVLCWWSQALREGGVGGVSVPLGSTTSVLRRNMISTRIQGDGNQMIFYHLRSSIDDVIFFSCKPQPNFFKETRQ